MPVTKLVVLRLPRMFHSWQYLPPVRDTVAFNLLPLLPGRAMGSHGYRRVYRRYTTMLVVYWLPCPPPDQR